LTWAELIADGNELRDVAEMSDGTVFVATLTGLYTLSGEWDLTEIARLEGCALSAVSCDVAAVAAPSGSDADAVVRYLHPDGYALAVVSGGLTELWEYIGGAWSLAATGDIGLPSCMFCVGGSVYVDAAAGVYSLRGSAMANVTDALPQLATQHGLAASAGGMPPSLFRGAWYNASMDAGADRLIITRAGISVEYVVTLDPTVALVSWFEGALPIAISDGTRLHVFSNPPILQRFAGAWFSIGDVRGWLHVFESVELSADAAVPTISAGHGADGRAWAVGSISRRVSFAQALGPGVQCYTDDDGSVVCYTTSICDTLFLIQPSGLAVHDVTLEWAETDTAPSIHDITLESSEGTGNNAPTIHDITLQSGEGTGNNAPTIHDITLESMSQARPTIHGITLESGSPAQEYPSVHAITVESGEGAGLNAPTIHDITLESGEGSGSNAPAVHDVTLEWSRGARLLPSVHSVTAEWAEYLGPDVGDGEGVLWLTVDDADRPAVAVRVVTDWDLDDEAALRCLVRADGEALAVTAYGSYQGFRPGADCYLENPGHDVRIGIVGPTAQEPPHVRVDVLRVDE